MKPAAVALLAAGVSSAVTGIVLQQFQGHVYERIYRNQLASCERGNAVREIVRANVTILLEDGRVEERAVERLREQLLSIEIVDCGSVIERP